MTTPRIEEMVEEVARKMGFRTEASFHTETIRQALTEVRQETLDEAVEMMEKALKENRGWVRNGDAHLLVQSRLKGNYLVDGLDTKVISQITAEAEDVFLDQALDDTIKALQDNK